MNFDTADLDACRDYIAEAMGWKPPGYKWPTGSGTGWPRDSGKNPVVLDVWRIVRNGVSEHSRSCPVGSDLDSAAASLPEGCRWCDITFCRNATIARCTNGTTIFVSDIEGDGSGKLELLARFRASAKAWAWVRENKP